MFLPYGRQTIDDEDIDAVCQALRSDYLTTGPLVERYEAALVKATGAPHVVSCNSGTAALHLAMLALEVGPADVVIVPSITFVATANAARMCGAKVVFADVHPDTGLVTSETMAEAQTRASRIGRVRAAFAVHLNGQLCDVAALKAQLMRDGIILVEDAAHALGADYRWDGLGEGFACFSTHPVKAIATGEGGFLVTSNPQMAARVSSFRSHGISRDAASFRMGDLAFEGKEVNPWHHEMHDLGWNYRIPDILCALGLSQLGKLSGFVARRKQIAKIYDDGFKRFAPAVRPMPRGNSPDGYHLYPLLVDYDSLGQTRKRFMELLKKRGVGSQVHYIPVHLQPYYRIESETPDLPGAQAYFERCLSIPFYPAMTDSEVSKVIEAVAEVVTNPG